MNPEPSQPDPARARFMVLQLLRWSGLVMVLIGLLIINQVISAPKEFGYVLFVIGLLDALIAPTVLARAWKTPLP